MARYETNGTIAAAATAPGEAGIGIVRISGRNALAIADKIFFSKSGEKPSGFKTRMVRYGAVCDNGSAVDEVLLNVMRAPKTYTREDTVEINCHGGMIALRKVLELVLANGARLAEPGEFTRRAFLNGRIDLAQAEAVLDVIRARTDSALKLSEEQLRGGLSSRINDLRNGLLKILAELEANIDFPEEETGKTDFKKIKSRLFKLKGGLSGILETSGRGRVLREGIRVAICGKPNAGKSSLLNALLKEERSIVTAVAGTTRDTIEEIIDIKGIPVTVIDTAGLIEPNGLVEKKAVQRSKKSIDTADLALVMFDASEGLNSCDNKLIVKLAVKPSIAVINKIDLKKKIDAKRLRLKFKRVVEISAKRHKNINLLEDEIADFVYSGGAVCRESAVVSNIRHIEALRQAQRFLEAAIEAVEGSLGTELVSQDIKDSLGCLDDILGKRFSESLLDEIFLEFCIGK